MAGWCGGPGVYGCGATAAAGQGGFGREPCVGDLALRRHGLILDHLQRLGVGRQAILLNVGRLVATEMSA